MKAKKLVNLLIPCLTMALVTSCGNKVDESVIATSTKESTETSEQTQESNSQEEISSDFERESISQEEDVIGLIPEEVLNADVEIDILEYIEGQNGTIKDLGSAKISAEDLNADNSKYYAAAREFKKIAPNVKINLIYCSISEYANVRTSYIMQKGHIPHIMHSTNWFYTDLESGLIADVSQYQDSEYYQAFNDYFLDQVTYGGFVTCFPTHYAPYGIFVNKEILSECYIVDTTDEDAYKEWVDNLTYEEWIESIKNTYVPNQHAGIGHVKSDVLSYIDDDLYRSFAEEGKINLSNSNLESLLALENESASYSIYTYPNLTNTGNAEAGFQDVKNWNMTRSFAQGMYTYNIEEPWNVGFMSQYVESEGKGSEMLDYIPYPKVDENDENNVGIKIGGLEIGNQCPIGQTCSAESQLEQDVAAYFTMFMINDPRAIQAKSEIQYQSDGNAVFTGNISLPMMEPNFKFSWQTDPEILETIEDPAADYMDNWQYQMSAYLKIYSSYWTKESEDDEPDVNTWSNVNYGFAKMMDIIYNHPEQNVNCSIVPSIIASGSGTELILDSWDNRYDASDLTEGIGTSTYVAAIVSNLSTMESKINSYSEEAYAYLQECIDTYYGEGLYNVLG